MSIYTQVGLDWTKAMKSRDPKKDVLSLIKTELKNKAINARTTGSTSDIQIEDSSALDVLMKMAKQRKESIEQYEKAKREDLAQKERFELLVIEAYLPTQLSREELLKEMESFWQEFPNASMKDIKEVMQKAMALFKGRALGSDIQALVKARLSP